MFEELWNARRTELRVAARDIAYRMEWERARRSGELEQAAAAPSQHPKHPGSVPYSRSKQPR